VPCVFLCNQTSIDETGQSLIEGVHLLPRTGLDQRSDLVTLVLSDEVPDSARGDHDFKGGNATAAIFAFYERLGHNAYQIYRQLHSNLLLLMGRKNVDNSVARRT